MIVALVLALLLVVCALVLVEPGVPKGRTRRTIRRVRDDQRAIRQWWPEPQVPVARSHDRVALTHHP